MSSRAIVEQTLSTHPSNQLILASKLYAEKFSTQMTELAYYKTLQRLCEKNVLAKIAKGVYCKPLETRFGTVLPSSKDIVDEFTKNSTGTVVGYTMYNALNLTTQVAKNIEVYSANMEEQQKKIGSVCLTKYQMDFHEDSIRTIQILEVLQHYDAIQDLNNNSFLRLCKEYSKHYSNDTCRYVLSSIKYSKRTIAFLRSILNFHGVDNSLNEYLSSLSEYRIPSMEELYETTRI